MTVPTSLKLGGRTWELVLVEDLKDSKGVECLGITHPSKCYIELEANQSAESLEHTYYHELLHAMCMTIGFEKLNRDEDHIDALANMLMQALQTKKGKLA